MELKRHTMKEQPAGLVMDGPSSWKSYSTGLMKCIRIIPVPKPRWAKSHAWDPPPGLTRYRAFRDKLSVLDPNIDWEDLEVIFIMPMPKSWPKKKKASHNFQPHLQVPDLDNLLKALQDAVMKDDSKVHHYADVRKVWGKYGGILYKPTKKE